MNQTTSSAALALACLLTACATKPPVKAVTAAASAASAVAAASGPNAAQGKPFDEVIKGATVQAGFFPLWRKDDKVWLEIPLRRLEQPFLFTVNISHSVGERGLYGSQMGPSWVATFRKIGQSHMQLVALNTDYIATTPSAQASAEQAFSSSLLGAVPLASAPHPERQSVLIDASFLLNDIPAYATQIEQAYRLPYSLDRATSYFEKTRATPELTTLATRMHYAMARIPAPPMVPQPNTPPLPKTLPDIRSFFVGYVYNLLPLPEKPWAPRRADPRLGHFSQTLLDLTQDLKADPKIHYIHRWRLEKADPSAALSPPKQPIIYWLDKNIPPTYRPAVEAGVLEWNRAFEKIGFKDAIIVQQQPANADWDSLDARHASIRWFTGTDVGFAKGPLQADPRTGEILDADIAMSDIFSRSARRFITEEVGTSAHAYCQQAIEAAKDMHFALDLLEARGELNPDSQEAQAFVYSIIKDTITHEVGHTLGLKHNFKGSTIYTAKQLQDPGFTAQHGISGSVMDYNALNLSLQNEHTGRHTEVNSLTNHTLGPYDEWAIAYAYQPFPPEQEAIELGRLAARSTEPLLAYADDAQAGLLDSQDSIDPLVNRFDLGDDPLAYYQKRLTLSRELWQRVQQRTPSSTDDPTRARRVLLSGFRPLVRAAELTAKYIGGLYTERDLPGLTARAAYTPVPPAKQRQALQFLTQSLFTAESFHFEAHFLASLSPDYHDWERAGPVSIPAAALQVQTAALDRLMSAGTAQRLIELPNYIDSRQTASLITLPEVYATVQQAIWSELKTGQDINILRRNLQREHLRRIQALLLHGGGVLLSDALSIVRLEASELQTQLRHATKNPHLSTQNRAHLNDCLSQLTQALQASMLRG